MLANPPYGKSWKKDLEAMGGKEGMRDPRFKVMHEGEELSLVTRSSDGQLLFLANMASKMNHKSALGSRIAEVHNGSSLFTGDAGSGESNIRRWIFENDWVEAIVALPLNLFYNTGIATYIWSALEQWEEGYARAQGQGAAHRREPVVQTAAQEPRRERTASCRRRTSDEFGSWPPTTRSKRPSRFEKIFPEIWRGILAKPEGDDHRATAAPSQPAHPEGHRGTALRLGRRGDSQHPLRRDGRRAFRRALRDVEESLEKRLAGGGDAADEDRRRRRPTKTLPKKGLAREEEKEAGFDPKTWERDARLMSTLRAHAADCEKRSATCAVHYGPQRVPTPRSTDALDKASGIEGARRAPI